MIPVITAVRLNGAAGRNELPLLILGPSAGSSALSLWSDCASILATDFDLLAWDLPGHGYNSGPVPDYTDPDTVPDLAAGVLAVVEEVLLERGEPGSFETRFAYAGVGIGGEVGERLRAGSPDRLWSCWTGPAECSPSEEPKQVAAQIVHHVLGRPPPPAAPAPGDLAEAANRRRIDDLTAPQYDALRGLVDALSDLALAGATTRLPTEQILEHTRTVHELTEALSSPPSDESADGWLDPVNRVTRTRYETPQRWAQEGRVVRINDLNPMHPGLDVHITASSPFVGRSATAEVVLNALQEGPPETAHGGTIASLMDVMVGILVQSTGVPAVTGQLNTRYLGRTPLERPVTLGSRILDRDGRKISTEAWIEVDGARTVEATALFIEVGMPERAGDPG
ncbi:hypothetical protein GCM10027020_33330 [Nocardioides salsibiostraticola]